jgi:uncharacterized protein
MKLWLVVLASGFVAVSLGSFWLAIRPPRLLVPETPLDYGLSFEAVTVVAPDGARLAAWLIPAAVERPSAAVILLHGYPAEKADLLPIAAALHPHFVTLLVDLRYFGQSEGRATTLGFRERGDLVRAVDCLTARGLGRIGVFGYSLGGAVALMGAAEDSRIGAIVAYAPFADLRTLAHELYARFWLLRYPFVELMLVWSRLFLGGDITRPSPADAAKRLTIPVLLIHNRDDEQISWSHAERLQRALRDNPLAEFHFGPGLHNDRRPDVDRRVVEFFRKHLESPGGVEKS